MRQRDDRPSTIRRTPLAGMVQLSRMRRGGRKDAATKCNRPQPRRRGRGRSYSTDRRFLLFDPDVDPFTLKYRSQLARGDVVPNQPAVDARPIKAFHADDRRVAKPPEEVLQPAHAIRLEDLILRGGKRSLSQSRSCRIEDRVGITWRYHTF